MSEGDKKGVVCDGGRECQMSQIGQISEISQMGQKSHVGSLFWKPFKDLFQCF